MLFSQHEQAEKAYDALTDPVAKLNYRQGLSLLLFGKRTCYLSLS